MNNKSWKKRCEDDPQLESRLVKSILDITISMKDIQVRFKLDQPKIREIAKKHGIDVKQRKKQSLIASGNNFIT